MLNDIFAPRSIGSREHLIREVQGALGDSLERVIDTHNTASVIFVYGQQGKRHLLKAEFGNKTATHNEIQWYRRIDGDFENTPRCLDFYTGQSYALLLLEYIEGASTIDEIALTGQNASDLVAQGVLRSFELDKQLFGQTRRSVPRSYVKQLFEGKYRLRREEAGATPYLRQLLDSCQIIVNGETLYSPDVALAKIWTSKSLAEYLTSDKVGLIHGDLHCGNILVSGDNIFWIDPNGKSEMPLEYDLGKLFHSIHGNYGSIMRGKYSMAQIAPLQFTISYDGPQAYKEAFRSLKQALTDREYAQGLYAEAMHFATMLPHHAANKQETTALYLRCVQLFNELFTVAT